MISNTYADRTVMMTTRWLDRQLHIQSWDGSCVYLWNYKQTALLRCQQAGWPDSCTHKFHTEALYTSGIMRKAVSDRVNSANTSRLHCYGVNRLVGQTVPQRKLRRNKWINSLIGIKTNWYTKVYNIHLSYCNNVYHCTVITVVHLSAAASRCADSKYW